MDEDYIVTPDNVRSKIENAISSWATMESKPPHSLEQMIVMALLASGQCLSVSQILTWICDHYKYYRHLIVKGFCEIGRLEASKFRSDVESTLDTFELPFQIIEEDLPDHDLNDEDYWTIQFRCGLPAVRHILAEGHDCVSKSPGFFKLPGELRNVIYNMVFGYPKESGLVIGLPRSDLDIRVPLWVLEKKTDQPFGLCELQLNGQRNSNQRAKQMTRPYREILAPLLTSRQFYKESVETFYRINHFHSESLPELCDFLESVAKGRRKYIQSITTTYWSSNAASASATFALLDQCDSLSILNLRIDERAWVERRNRRIKQAALRRGIPNPTEFVSNALELPGMSTLRCLRGLQEVNIEGAGQAVVDTIRADLLKPKLAHTSGSK